MCSSRNKKTNREGRLFLAVVVTLLSSGLSGQVEPSQYGRVVLNKYSAQAGLGPVTFDHWLHRSKFTCRVCHVDIGFAMQANATGVRAATNRQGFHCGACHDGKRTFDGKVVFAACSDKAPTQECARCHSASQSTRKYDYQTFTAKLPKNAYGIDWEEAEAVGLIKPVDVIEGLSIKKPALKSQEDFSIQPRVTWVSDIIFSHKKHTVWNGCELCHPEIFPAAKKSVVRYTMFHISSGEYCGVCHGKVAFPVTACSECHKNTQDKAALKDVVVLPGPARASGFGSVRFMHKTHVGEHGVKCEACHHPPKGPGTEKTTEQMCSSCHTRQPLPPVKTTLQSAFHNQNGTAGVCIDCHKAENAKSFSNDVEFVRALLPHDQAVIDTAKAQLVYGKDPQMRQLAQEIVTDRQSEADQLQVWLKEHEAATWAPVKCRDCHKKANNLN